jgi:hypothetical protein
MSLRHRHHVTFLTSARGSEKNQRDRRQKSERGLARTRASCVWVEKKNSTHTFPPQMWACPACTYEQADSRKQCKLCLTMRPDLVALQKQLYAEPVKPKAKGKAKASCDSVRGGRPTQNVAKARSPKRPLPAASHVASAHMQHLQSKRPAASASAWFDDEDGAPPCILEAVAVEPEPVESDEDSSSDLTSDDAVLTYELQLPALKSKAVGKAARVRLPLMRALSRAPHFGCTPCTPRSDPRPLPISATRAGRAAHRHERRIRRSALPDGWHLAQGQPPA